jgi:FkbM family methyltransferase
MRPHVVSTDELTRLAQGRHGPMVYGRNDMFIGRSVDLYGEWAQAELDLLGVLLKPGDVAIDVGANIGTHAVFFGQRVGTEGRVYAFEPQGMLFRWLSDNVALNQLSNVVLFPMAVGRTPGTIGVPEVDYGRAGNFGGLSLPTMQSATPRIDSVPVTTLDQLARDHLAPTGRPCKVLKIDVEGMELDVLEGGRALIESQRPFIYLENNDPARSKGVLSWLLARRYCLFWHFSPFFNPANFRGNPNNVFGSVGDLNVIAVRAELAAAFARFPAVAGADDTWAALQERRRIAAAG